MRRCFELIVLATTAVILVATGSEVQLALGAAQMLEKDGVKVRVVSMPSWDIFEKWAPFIVFYRKGQ